MPDFADEGSAITERDLQIALAAQAAKPRAGVRPFTGSCYYCKEPVTEPNRFCDEDCKVDHMYEEERKAQLRLF